MAGNGDCLDGPDLHQVEDAVYAALSDRDRRIALYYVRWRGRVDVDELADVVVGWRNADARGMATREERDRVRIELHSRHLPILADADLLDYDDETETVARRPLPDPVASMIELAYELEVSARGSS